MPGLVPVGPGRLPPYLTLLPEPPLSRRCTLAAMDPVEGAACVILGVFAVLFSWTGFRRREPPASPTATTSIAPTHVTYRPSDTPQADASEEAISYIREACRVHARWSGANGDHVACFDLFGILQTDSVSFSGDADAFAAVIGPVIDGNNRYVFNAYHACGVGSRLTRRWEVGAMMRRYGSCCSPTITFATTAGGKSTFRNSCHSSPSRGRPRGWTAATTSPFRPIFTGRRIHQSPVRWIGLVGGERVVFVLGVGRCSVRPAHF